MEYAQGADLAIHECFVSPQDLIAKQAFTPGAALNVGTQIHTSPAQFGKVMAETKPRMAVGYHFFNDFDTAPNVLRDVRMTYDGPLALATDYMVFNLRKEGDVKVRMAAVDEDIWPQPSTIPLVPPDVKLQRTFLSEYMKGGRVVHKEVLERVYDQINKLYGTTIPVPE
jgi:ribonuclease Z